jgi:uncharacterized protein
VLVDANVLCSLDEDSPFHVRARDWMVYVESWLDAPATWIPAPGWGHCEILGSLLVQHVLRAGLVTDAALATICIEHGLTMISADSDFARFPQIDWMNPVAAS